MPLLNYAKALALAAPLAALPALALESQALGWVEPLPAQISQVFACGTWSVAQHSGYYRVVLAEVNEGAGTEVYIQRIQETVEASSRSIRVLETTPVRALNNDHAQYQVSSAKCTGTGTRAALELRATFEHDESNAVRRIRIPLGSWKSTAPLAAVEPDQRVLQKTGAGVSKASR